MKERILIIEDDKAIRDMLRYTLTKHGYGYEEAAEVVEANKIIEQFKPDLILLDWMLPGMSGVDYARQLRKNIKTMAVPIIMLTARSAEADKVKALDTGSDDFITKPFSTRELLARIRAVIRRTKKQDETEVIEVNNLRLDPDSCRVTINGNFISLSPTEFKLLHFFITHPGKVYNRTQLLDQIWGQNVYVEERTVDVHIRRLRKSLQPYGFDDCIQTVRSFGYRFSTI